MTIPTQNTPHKRSFKSSFDLLFMLTTSFCFVLGKKLTYQVFYFVFLQGHCSERNGNMFRSEILKAVVSMQILLAIK